MIEVTFTVKEFFEPINRSEIMFLNKGLKRLSELKKIEISKATLPGERFASNQWPISFASFACALLVGLRSGRDRAALLHSYIDYPCGKGWDTPFCDGKWEEFAKGRGIDL